MFCLTMLSCISFPFILSFTPTKANDISRCMTPLLRNDVKKWKVPKDNWSVCQMRLANDTEANKAFLFLYVHTLGVCRFQNCIHWFLSVVWRCKRRGRLFVFSGIFCKDIFHAYRHNAYFVTPFRSNDGTKVLSRQVKLRFYLLAWIWYFCMSIQYTVRYATLLHYILTVLQYMLSYSSRLSIKGY